MSAYERGALGINGYLLRILTAIVRQNGGELRVKGELIDSIGEPTALIKEWDHKAQELVLRSGMGSFVEVFTLNPERQAPVRQAPAPEDPLAAVFKDSGKSFTPKTSTIDNPNLAELERKRAVAHAAALLKDELMRRKLTPQD